MDKKTKIIATIGPASSSKEVLEKMIEAGMNVARINFSHGDHDSNGKLIDIIKEIREEKGMSVGILADLQGPRIRVGNEKSFNVQEGETILVSDKKTDAEKELVIDSLGVARALEVGERILIEDGLMQFEVMEKAEKGVVAKVINGGEIKPRKGVNVPDTKLTFGAVTEKDERDLEFVVKEKDVDFVALSFVSNAREVQDVRKKIVEILGREEGIPKIVAKIERKEALKNIDEIIEATDVVMVARGDLGIELDESKVVIYQKEIIAKCLKANRTVIVATQMLDSMINNPLPTRAEVSDVSNAVIDHTDAVMLSGETANGKYPVKTVETMAKIIHDTEESPFDDTRGKFLDKENFSEYASVVDSAHELAKTSKAKAILMFSFWGGTPKMVSQHRPEQLMLFATNNLKTFHQSSMMWGVRGFLLGPEENTDNFFDILVEKAKEAGKLSKGDKVVTIMGRTPDGKRMRFIGIQEVE